MVNSTARMQAINQRTFHLLTSTTAFAIPNAAMAQMSTMDKSIAPIPVKTSVSPHERPPKKPQKQQ